MLNQKIVGKGEHQLIFIHGNSQSLDFWEQVLGSELQENYTLIALDLPGHGQSFRSATPNEDYSLKGLAKNVRESIKRFENKPYLLVGNSLGTNIIGEFAAEIRNCKGIVLIGSSAIGMGLAPSDVLQPNPNVGIFFSAEYTEFQLRDLANDVLFNATDLVKSSYQHTFSATDPAFRAALAESVVNSQYDDELQNISNTGLPVAVVFGAEEKICVASYFDELPLKKWQNKTILIPASGHCPQVEQPEKLTEIIRSFADDCFK